MTAAPADVHCEPASESDLYRRIVSWRRSRIDPDLSKAISERVARARSKGDPIEFSVPFGGYKAWHQPSYPHLNWAEVMWLDYLRRFGERIAAAHRPGVVISLSYYGAVMDLVNNMPVSDQAVYAEEITELARRMSGPRVHLEAVDLAALHGGTEHFRAHLRTAMDSQGPPDEQHLISAGRNLVGTQRSGDQWEAAVVESARACQALESLPPRRDFNKFGPRIQITHQRGPAQSLHLGSTRASTVQPWVGTGYLRPGRTGLVEQIATRLPEVERHRVNHRLDDFAFLQAIPVAVG